MKEQEITNSIIQIMRFWQTGGQGLEIYLTGLRKITKMPSLLAGNEEAWILWYKTNFTPTNLLVTGALPSEIE